MRGVFKILIFKKTSLTAFAVLRESLVGGWVYIIQHAVAQRPIVCFASKPPLTKGILRHDALVASWLQHVLH